MARTIEGHERRLGSWAVLVDSAGNHFFACAALTGDQHRHILGRDPADGLVHLAHRRAEADDGLLRVRFHAGFHRGWLADAAGDVQRLADDSPQQNQVEGYEQAVIGPLFHGLDGRVGPPGPGDDDDRDACVAAADLLVDFQPGLVDQTQVQDNDIRGPGADVLEAGTGSVSDQHPVPGCGKARRSCSGIKVGSLPRKSRWAGLS